MVCALVILHIAIKDNLVASNCIANFYSVEPIIQRKVLDDNYNITV